MSTILDSVDHDGFQIVILTSKQYNKLIQNIDRDHKNKIKTLEAYYKKKNTSPPDKKMQSKPKYPQSIAFVNAGERIRRKLLEVLTAVEL